MMHGQKNIKLCDAEHAYTKFAGPQ